MIRRSWRRLPRRHRQIFIFLGTVTLAIFILVLATSNAGTFTQARQ